MCHIIRICYYTSQLRIDSRSNRSKLTSERHQNHYAMQQHEWLYYIITCDVNVVRLVSFCALNVTFKSFHCLKFVLYSPRLEWEGDRQDGGQGNKNISNIRKHNIKCKKRNIRKCKTLVNHSYDEGRSDQRREASSLKHQMHK